jgi:hypothetical protein
MLLPVIVACFVPELREDFRYARRQRECGMPSSRGQKT